MTSIDSGKSIRSRARGVSATTGSVPPASRTAPYGVARPGPVGGYEDDAAGLRRALRGDLHDLFVLADREQRRAQKNQTGCNTCRSRPDGPVRWLMSLHPTLHRHLGSLLQTCTPRRSRAAMAGIPKCRPSYFPLPCMRHPSVPRDGSRQDSRRCRLSDTTKVRPPIPCMMLQWLRVTSRNLSSCRHMDRRCCPRPARRSVPAIAGDHPIHGVQCF